MTRRVVVAVVAAVLLSGCAGGGAGAAASGESAAADWPAGVKEAEVYAAVLHQFLATPSDNSFPDMHFATVYVLDRDARGGVIAGNTQEQLVAALADVTGLKFIADRESVLEHHDGCAEVRDGGMLMTLGPVDGDDNEVTVAVNGFVACLGASMLTYVVARNDPGPGWTVTGTTGSRAVA